jgi:hypothetical protein
LSAQRCFGARAALGRLFDFHKCTQGEQSGFLYETARAKHFKHDFKFIVAISHKNDGEILGYAAPLELNEISLIP